MPIGVQTTIDVATKVLETKRVAKSKLGNTKRKLNTGRLFDYIFPSVSFNV